MTPTIEKDIDISGDRDVQRASFTGSDDKSKTYASASDLKVDVGEAEAVAANLAGIQGVGANLLQMATLQQMRHTEELFNQRMQMQAELASIRQRQLSNAADYDQDIRELRVSHSKSRNSQDVKHADIAADRLWNVDEQGYQVAKIVEALGVDHRIAYAAVLEALASLARSTK
jgi:murein L,D-transpeptidase YcbB/YkuD